MLDATYLLSRLCADELGVKASRGVRKDLPPRVKQAARSWFLSRDNSEGSFEFTCDVIGLDPSATRRAVLQCQEFSGIRARHRFDFD